VHVDRYLQVAQIEEILWEQWKLGKLDGIVHKGWKKGGEGGTGCGSKRLEERGPEAAKGGLIAGDCDVVGARLWG